MPPDSFLPGLRELCDRHGILLIADEVQSGTGRTGKMFAVEHWGVQPDIIATAKGLASGMPIGTVTARQSLMEQWPHGAHGNTYGGNPLCCAAALATIDLVEKEYKDNATTVGQRLLERMKALGARYPVIGEVRGKGLMIGLELVSEKEKTPAVEQAKQVRKLCREGGILVGVGGTFGNVVRLQPPLVLSDEEAHRVTEVLTKTLANVSA